LALTTHPPVQYSKSLHRDPGNDKPLVNRGQNWNRPEGFEITNPLKSLAQLGGLAIALDMTQAGTSTSSLRRRYGFAVQAHAFEMELDRFLHQESGFFERRRCTDTSR
jgi:hypothetical protein